MIGAACSTALEPAGERVLPEDEGTNSRGELWAHFEAAGSVVTPCGEAAGIRLALIGPEGQAEACEEAWLDVGGTRIADCFLVVEPGDWRFTELSAVDAEWRALACCTSQHPDHVSVTASETTEVAASIACAAEDAADENGGLDVEVTFNQAPLIVDVTVVPSLQGETCVPFALTAHAVDPEGDAISYAWSVVFATSDDYTLEAMGATAAFAAARIGDYTIQLIATDEFGASTSFDVPLEVSSAGGPLGCDTEEACEGLLGVSIELGL